MDVGKETYTDALWDTFPCKDMYQAIRVAASASVYTVMERTNRTHKHTCENSANGRWNASIKSENYLP